MNKKLRLNARDTKIVNCYLANLQNGQMNEKEKLVNADDINLSEIDSVYHPFTRDIPHKHEVMWNG